MSASINGCHENCFKEIIKEDEGEITPGFEAMWSGEISSGLPKTITQNIV